MPNGDSAKTCVLGNNNKTRLDGLEHERDNLWHAIEEIRRKLDRLPAWATLVMMVMSAAIGALLTVVAT